MPDEYTASGHHSDYARRIQNEMNRDAMPSPAEIEQERKSYECEHCGEKNEDLDHRMAMPHYFHDCPAYQQPDPEPIWLCKECKADHDPEADFLERQREREETVVLYKCGMVDVAEEPEVETVEYRGEEVPHPHADARERIPVECVCGAAIDEVFY